MQGVIFGCIIGFWSFIWASLFTRISQGLESMIGLSQLSPDNETSRLRKVLAVIFCDGGTTPGRRSAARKGA